MKLTRQDYILAGGQALLWITLWLIPPAIDFFIRFNPSSAFEVWKINTGFITPLAIVFTVNFYVLVPYLLYRDRKMLFGLMNLLLITGANLWIFSPKADFPGRMAFGNVYGRFRSVLLTFASGWMCRGVPLYRTLGRYADAFERGAAEKRRGGIGLAEEPVESAFSL